MTPHSGIVAGCSLADIALRCVMAWPANDVARVLPRVTTRAYADDVKFSARGPANQVARDGALATKVWDASAASFGGVLSRAKCTLSANTSHAANKLKAATAGEGSWSSKRLRTLARPAREEVPGGPRSPPTG